jgi:uncharacterized protein (UPF0371 family)
MRKPSELAQLSIDEWEAVPEAERESVVREYPEADGQVRVCRAYLRLRERIGMVADDLERGSKDRKVIASQLRSDLEMG